MSVSRPTALHLPIGVAMTIASAGWRRELVDEAAWFRSCSQPVAVGSGLIRKNLGHSLRSFRLAQVAHDDDHHSQRHHQQQEPPLFPSGKVIAGRTFGGIEAEQFRVGQPFQADVSGDGDRRPDYT